MTNYVVGNRQTHYYSQGDTTCRCPKCYGSNAVTSMGILTIDNVQHETLKCNTCNVLFSGVDGGIASMIDEAKSTYGTSNVGFVPGSIGTMTGSAGITITGNGTGIQSSNQISLSPIETKTDWETKSKFDQMNSNLSNIHMTIELLVSEIRKLTEQNVELMNKVQSDPLISIKKAVSEFNLK